MKNILYIFIITFIFTQIYPQQKEKYSKSVTDFIDILYNKTLIEETNYSLHYSFSKEQSKEILQKFYKVKAYDPIGLFNYFTEEYKVIIKKTKATGKNSKEKRAPYRKKKLADELAKIYGKKFMDIIDVPYFLRIKILSKVNSIYISPGPPESKYGTIQMKVMIDDVIKGKSVFSKGSIITIEYLTRWLKESPKQFKVGGSYFVPIRPWMGTKGFLGWTLNFLPDNNFSIYEIHNDSINTPGNYFDIGTEMNWADFRKLFTKKYILLREGDLIKWEKYTKFYFLY